MTNTKKQRRRERALERLEKKIELDGLGFAKSSQASSNKFSHEIEHHALRKNLGKLPKFSGNPKPRPS